MQAFAPGLGLAHDGQWHGVSNRKWSHAPVWCRLCSGSPLGPQVPFERVPDLVAGRRVLLRGGWAYVSRHEVAPLLTGRYHMMRWFCHLLSPIQTIAAEPYP